MQVSPKGVSTLNRLFNIRTGEWPRVSLLFLMSGLTNAGAIWGTSITYAAFLQQIGIEALPWILAIGSVLSIIAIAIYTAFVDRIANDRLLIIIFAIGAAGIIIGLALLWFNLFSIAYPFLFLLLTSLMAVINSHQVTYFNDFYDTQEAKRVLPVVFAGYRIGAIVAGLTIPLLNRWFGPGQIITLWLLTSLAVIVLVWLMPRLLKENITPSSQVDCPSSLIPATSEKRPSSYIENVRQGFHYTTQSIYLRWIAAGTLLLMVLMALLQYRSSELLLETYDTVEELADFMGLLAGLSNIVALPILLLGMSRLLTRLGLGKASLIFPAGNLLACAGLIFWPGWATATAAYLDRTSFRITFRGTVDSLFYNAVSLRVKGRARAFVGGLVMPMGSFIGGLLLLLPFASTVWFVAILIGVLAITYTICALVTSRLYSQALIKMLEQEDFSSLLLSHRDSPLPTADPAALKLMKQKLQESPNHQFTIFIAQLISQFGGSEAVPILGQTARATAEGRERAAILDVLAAAGIYGRAIRRLYIEFLADGDGRVRQSAMAGLEQLAGPEDDRFLDLAIEMLSDQDIDVRIQVLSALARSGNFHNLSSAAEALDQLLTDTDPHRRARGVRILGRIGDRRAIHSLVKYLADPEDEVRLAATMAIEELSKNKILKPVAPLVLKQMSRLLQDPVEHVRQATLEVFERLGSQEQYQAFVEALTDASPQVRATAVDILVRLGKPVIPIVQPQLDSPDRQQRKMAAVILSRISPTEFGGLVESHITNNLLAIYRNCGRIEALSSCAHYPGISVLQSGIWEQNQQLVGEIFDLLMTTHDPQSIAIVNQSLQSNVARIRANATEALETLTLPRTAQLIAPLFESNMTPAQLLGLGQDIRDMELPDPARTIEELITDLNTPWLLRAMMTFALGEIGASLSPDEASLDKATQPEEPKTNQPEPADQSGVLPDVLTDATQHTTPRPLVETKKTAFLMAFALVEEQETASWPSRGVERLGQPSSSDQALPARPEVEAVLATQHTTSRPLVETKKTAFLMAFALAEEQEAVSWPSRGVERLGQPSPSNQTLPARPEIKTVGTEIENRRQEPTAVDQPARPEVETAGAETAAFLLAFVLTETPGQPTPSDQSPLTRPKIEALLETSAADSKKDVRQAAQAARRLLAGQGRTNGPKTEGIVLSIIEKIIFLKEVPFFQGMTVNQLEILARVCEEEFFEAGRQIFDQGDPGDALYVIVSGQVSIEQEKGEDAYIRLATLGAHTYFGEMTLFDSSPRTASAIALQDTLMLRLRREPLVALARQYPDVSLELIQILSQQLRQISAGRAELMRPRAREL